MQIDVNAIGGDGGGGFHNNASFPGGAAGAAQASAMGTRTGSGTLNLNVLARGGRTENVREWVGILVRGVRALEDLESPRIPSV